MIRSWLLPIILACVAIATEGCESFVDLGAFGAGATGGPVNRVALSGPSQLVTARCSSAYTVTLVDASGRMTSPISSTAVSLSGGAAGFYSDSGCLAKISSVTLSSSSTSAIFYVKSLSGSSFTLNASATGVASTSLAVTQSLVLGQVDLLVGGYWGSGAADATDPTLVRFSGVRGLVARPGALYVMDTQNRVIRQVNTATGATSLVAGWWGERATVNDIGTAARFECPAQAVYLSGFIYLADECDHSIRKMDLTTLNVTTIAGGSLGTSDGAGAGAQFHSPEGLATDGTDLYVSDALNNCIRKVTTAGVVTTLSGVCQDANSVPGGHNDGAAGVAQYSQPARLAYAAGFLYVTEYNNHDVRKVSVANGTATTLAGDFSNSGLRDGTGTGARFYNPVGIDTDGTYLYVADSTNLAIRKVTIGSGVVQTIAGGARGYSDGVNSGIEFGLNSRGSDRMQDVALASGGGTLYVADSDNNRIRAIDLSSGQSSTLAGPPDSLLASSADTGNTNGLGDTQVNNPQQMVELNDSLYFTDSLNGAIRRFDLKTRNTSLVAGSGDGLDPRAGIGAGARFNYPKGIATDGTYLYVSNEQGHCIQRVVPATGAVTVLTGQCGTSGYNDDPDPNLVQFNVPQGLAVDPTGQYLFVADRNNQVVRKVTLSTGATTTAYGSTQGYLDDIGTAARFSLPETLASDGINTLYVVDALNCAVRSIDLSSGLVSTLVGGSCGFADGVGGAAQMSTSTYGITTDGFSVYVTDNGNSAIRKITISTREMTTLFSSAATPASGDDDNAVPNYLRDPIGIHYSNSGLYFSEAHSIRIYH